MFVEQAPARQGKTSNSQKQSDISTGRSDRSGPASIFSAIRCGIVGIEIVEACVAGQCGSEQPTGLPEVISGENFQQILTHRSCVEGAGVKEDEHAASGALVKADP